MSTAKKLWYENHKEQAKANHKKWYAENREYLLKKRRLQYVHKPKCRCLYTVWNNNTDEIVIVDGTVKQCADAMGINLSSFHSIRTRTKQGKMHKWTIEERKVYEIDGKGSC